MVVNLEFEMIHGLVWKIKISGDEVEILYQQIEHEQKQIDSDHVQMDIMYHQLMNGMIYIEHWDQHLIRQQ